MPRIDEMPEYRAKLPRSTHELSHDFGFTATTAHLLPVFHHICSPGDKLRIGTAFDITTMPMQAAAKMRLRTHVEYFFVPMQLLYEPFGSMFYQVNDNYSSNFQPVNPINLITLPVYSFNSALTDFEANDKTLQTGAFGETNGQNVYRLLDMFGFNPVAAVSNTYPTTTTGWNPSVFPYQILAYNCIYQYYYRLDNREVFDQSSFNWDKFYQTASVDENSWSFDNVRLHYRPLQDDYFTNVKVSPIVDVLNIYGHPGALAVTNSWLSRNTYPDQNSNQVGVISSGSTGNTSAYASGAPAFPWYRDPTNSTQTNFGFASNVVNTNFANGSDINTANIRAMFANEKLWSVTGRAKKHYDDQTLAHFGVNVPHDVKHEISMFGHDRSNIVIGEVFNTSDSYDPGTGSGTPLGEIAGKGYGHQDVSYHDFTAPVHGVFMAIFSVVPDINYENSFMKVNSITGKFDFPIPEYDHLGMQPLFSYEANIRNAYSSGTVIKGWQYRYEQFKRRYNRVSMAFSNSASGSLKSWMPSIVAYRSSIAANPVNSSSFQEYIYLPTDLNQIMLGQYQSTWSTAFSTNSGVAIYNNDPFVVDMHIDAKLTSWMSDYSLPRLDA